MLVEDIRGGLNTSLATLQTVYSRVNELVTWREVGVYLAIGGGTWVLYKIFKPLWSPLGKIPGPPFKPLVGNMYDVVQTEAMSNTLAWMSKYKSKVVRYYAFYGEPRVLVADPDLIKYISVTNSKNYVRTSGTTSLTGLFSKFLIFLSGQEHHALRRLVNPAFNINIIESFVPAFVKNAEKVVTMWDERITENGSFAKVDAQTVVARLTLDLMCECGFDYPLHAIENPDSAGTVSFSRVFNANRIRLSQMVPLLRSLPTATNKQLWEDVHVLKSTVTAMINKRRQLLQNSSAKGESSASHKGDLMSVLLQAKDEKNQSVPDKFIFDQIAGFFFAGYETTSTLLTWSLMLLAEHQKVQDKVRSEVKSVLSNQKSPLSLSDLDKMPYLTCALKEALRMYPPVYNVFRRAVRDDHLGEHFIPAGTVVGISISGLHKHPDNWEDPDTYKPERFLEEINPYKFQPFGSGPFMCIGHRFAMTEAKIILATLLKNFRFEMVPGYTYKRVRYLTVKPHPSLVLNVFRA